jgi:hypothetical protein
MLTVLVSTTLHAADINVKIIILKLEKVKCPDEQNLTSNSF